MEPLYMSKREIEEAIREGKITVTVVGLGNIGLPLAVALANKGCKVYGYDIDRQKIESLKKGQSYLPHEPKLDTLPKLVKQGKLIPTLNGEKAIANSDVIIVIIPLLADPEKKVDLTNIIEVSILIGKNIKKGSLVVVSTTVPPGTTEGVIKWIIEKQSGLKAGEDFGLAFVPERVKSGSVIDDFLKNYPIIVGGVDDKSTDAIANFYEAIVENKVLKAKKARVAELVKMFKSFYRYLNIALANDYAIMSEILGADIKEIIELSNTEPYSHIHYPGPGVGGKCIPVYPYLLEFTLSLFGKEFALFNIAREINKNMANHAIYLLFEALNEAGKTINGSKIIVLGLTFRGNVKVTYNSPAKPIIQKLIELGAEVIAHDTMLTQEEIAREFKVKSTSNIWEAVKDADAVLLVTDHREYKDIDIKQLIEQMKKPPVIIDTRNIFNIDNIKNLGEKIIYRGIGRGKYLFSDKDPLIEKIREYVLEKYELENIATRKDTEC